MLEEAGREISPYPACHDMNLQERVVLTLAMRDSGHTLDWRREALGGPVVNKHSTGGMGDVTSLMLGPMIASCGGFVPMVSGRGLRYTGGTPDKLEAIPGLAIFLDDDAFRAQIKQFGVAMMGQTHSLALVLAVKRIYAPAILPRRWIRSRLSPPRFWRKSWRKGWRRW